MLKSDRTLAYWRINAFIFVISVIIMLAVSDIAGDFIEDGVFYVFPKRSYDSVLTHNEITRIENWLRLQDIYVSYEAVGSRLIKSESMTALSTVIYTGSDYAYMNKLIFTDGWFFVKNTENANAAVLSEALAWKLFGNAKAKGMKVVIGEAEYEVAGVIAQKEMGQDNYFAWLPMDWDNPNTYAECLFIQSSGYNKIDSYKTLYSTLEANLDSISNYNITDINEYINIISKRLIFALSFLGIYIIFLFAVRLYGIN